MQELNISDNNLNFDSAYNRDMSGVSAISNAIPTMEAMVSGWGWGRECGVRSPLR